MMLLEEFENLMTKKSIQFICDAKQTKGKLPTTVSLKVRKYYDPSPTDFSNKLAFSPNKGQTLHRTEESSQRLRFNRPFSRNISTPTKLPHASPSSLCCSKAVFHLEEWTEFALRKKTITPQRLHQQVSK